MPLSVGVAAGASAARAWTRTILPEWRFTSFPRIRIALKESRMTRPLKRFGVSGEVTDTFLVSPLPVSFLSTGSASIARFVSLVSAFLDCCSIRLLFSSIAAFLDCCSPRLRHSSIAARLDCCSFLLLLSSSAALLECCSIRVLLSSVAVLLDCCSPRFLLPSIAALFDCCTP